MNKQELIKVAEILKLVHVNNIHVMTFVDAAIAALTAEPVMYASEETLAAAKQGELLLRCLSEPAGHAVIPLYTAPPAPDLGASQAAEVARAALDYIDALPDDVVASLPVMPGFDRDWAENVLKGSVADE